MWTVSVCKKTKETPMKEFEDLHKLRSIPCHGLKDSAWENSPFLSSYWSVDSLQFQ